MRLITVLLWIIAIVPIALEISYHLGSGFRQAIARSKEAVCQESKRWAYKYSVSQYYVKKRASYWLGVSLLLHTADDKRKPVEMWFPKTHPQIEKLKRLVRLDLVGFRFRSLPYSEVKPTEPAAYLELVKNH
jgi:hypothetical protein